VQTKGYLVCPKCAGEIAQHVARLAWYISHYIFIAHLPFLPEVREMVAVMSVGHARKYTPRLLAPASVCP
jgi:hypothetical protein